MKIKSILLTQLNDDKIGIIIKKIIYYGMGNDNNTIVQTKGYTLRVKETVLQIHNMINQ